MSKYNFQCLLIAGLAIILVQLPSYGQRSLELSDIFEDNLYQTARVPGFNFLKDGRHYTRASDKIIAEFDIQSGEQTDILFDATQFEGVEGFPGVFDSYKFSADESKIVLKTSTERIYRRSTKAYFYVYHRDRGALEPVFNEDKHRYATLSPDGTKIAFVYQNNLYSKVIGSDEIKQITHDGEANAIINGATDWVYEEEFGFARAFKWSPDSRRIAFMRFDEREVPLFTMTQYRNDLYPEYVTFKYPKVGEPNAGVSVHFYDLEKDNITEVDLPADAYYVPRIFWTADPNRLCIFSMNRHQNRLDLLLAKATNGKTSELLTETDRYYIDIHDNLTFTNDGENFLWTSEKDGYNHIYLYNMRGEELRDLTPGPYDVTAFYGYDPIRRKVYYQAAGKDALNRELYAVTLDGKRETLHNEKGWNQAQFSSTYDYYVRQYSDANTPTEYVVYDNTGERLRVLEDNDQLKRRKARTKISPVEFFEIPTEGGISLNAWMIKPYDFDPAQKYPVFMFLYGGPGSQQVTNRWPTRYYWWFQMLAQQGIMVACVDNRGTGARGSEFKKMTYMRLGHYETIDQIAAARYIAGLDYTDPNRVGIFGWSYGGYMSSLCILKGNDVFSLAIAVAPVTNWKWYDTIYTERYMRTEEENPNGYSENSPVNFAHRLNGDYLIVHGLSDDNVHPQHTIEMSRALVEHGRQFDTYLYPNNDHGLRGTGARMHLFTKMTNFIHESFKINH